MDDPRGTSRQKRKKKTSPCFEDIATTTYIHGVCLSGVPNCFETNAFALCCCSTTLIACYFFVLFLQVQGSGEPTEEGLQVYEPTSEGPWRQVHSSAWVPVRSSEVPARQGLPPEDLWRQGNNTKTKRTPYEDHLNTQRVANLHQSLRFMCTYSLEKKEKAKQAGYS